MAGANSIRAHCFLMSRKTRILVIEDDPSVREEYSLALRTEGYEVSEASSGVEGLRIFCEKHPQLVFLDVTLPDKDAREVCRFIKADTSRPEASVVLFSGRGSPPEEGVQAFEDLGGGLLIPVHWATFNLALHPWTEPVDRVWREAKARGLRLAVPRPGERVDVDSPNEVDGWWQALA